MVHICSKKETSMGSRYIIFWDYPEEILACPCSLYINLNNEACLLPTLLNHTIGGDCDWKNTTTLN